MISLRLFFVAIGSGLVVALNQSLEITLNGNGLSHRKLRLIGDFAVIGAIWLDGLRWALSEGTAPLQPLLALCSPKLQLIQLVLYFHEASFRIGLLDGA
jgi:hypothetical protein